jgi:hypothetical protein
MIDFANVLTTGPKLQHKATAVFATGAIMLAILGILIVAVKQAPLGVVAP